MKTPEPVDFTDAEVATRTGVEVTTFADEVIGLAEAEDAFKVVGMIEDEEATIVLLDVAAMELDAAFELVAAIDDEASSPLQSECIRNSFERETRRLCCSRMDDADRIGRRCEGRGAGEGLSSSLVKTRDQSSKHDQAKDNMKSYLNSGDVLRS